MRTLRQFARLLLVWVQFTMTSDCSSVTNTLGGCIPLGGGFRAVTQAIYHVVLCATYPTVTIVLNGITQLLLCDYWEIILGILQ